MNTNHCILPHDVREQGPLSPQIKQAPTSNILNFGSCKPMHLETGSSFHSLSSAPPLSQYDFQRQFNMHSSSHGCIPDTSAQGNVGKMPTWALFQNSTNFNARDGVDVHPIFPSRPVMNANNGSSHGLCDDINALRQLITHPGSRNESGINTSLQKGVTCAPTRSSNLPDASLQTPSSVYNKQSSVAGGCPRVFCMGASEFDSSVLNLNIYRCFALLSESPCVINLKGGDLLLSNTGVFGILCSCHGLHMSVSEFCEVI